MNLNIKEEIDDKSFIPQNCQKEIEKAAGKDQPFKMNLNIKEEVDDESFILQNSKNEIEESEITLQEPEIGLFECEDCSEQFQICDLFKLHTMIHGTNKICPHCEQTFFERSSFIEHIEDHIKNYIKCEYCPKIFFVKEIYIYHWRWHNRFQCTVCNERFLSKEELSFHVRCHVDEATYKCDDCGKTYKNPISFRTHSYRCDKQTGFRCDVCIATFDSAGKLKQHKKRLHDIGRKMTCKECGLDFQNQKSFFAHRQQEHPDSYYRKCQLCNLEFASISKYYSHRKKHAESGNLLPPVKPVKANQTTLIKKRCFLCGNLVDKTHLKQHKDTHVETMCDDIGECGLISAYRCKECGTLAATKIHALRHLDAHMKKTCKCKHPDCHAFPSMTYMGYQRHRFKFHKTVTCDDCNRQFTSKGGLSLHRLSGYCSVIASKSTTMAREHKSSVNPSKCNHCDRMIMGVSRMRQHIATKHAPATDQKTTGQCSICNERFETKKSYQDHMKKRHGPQYICPKCKRNFSSAYACQTHVKKDVCGGIDDAVAVNQVIFCKYCASCLSGVITMIEHLVDHHPDEDKYVCLLCEKTFKNFALHASHRKEHPQNRLRAKYIVQLEEVICGTQLKRDPVNDNFEDVPENVVVQQDGEVLSVGDQ